MSSATIRKCFMRDTASVRRDSLVALVEEDGVSEGIREDGGGGDGK